MYLFLASDRFCKRLEEDIGLLARKQNKVSVLELVVWCFLIQDTNSASAVIAVCGSCSVPGLG